MEGKREGEGNWVLELIYVHLIGCGTWSIDYPTPWANGTLPDPHPLHPVVKPDHSHNASPVHKESLYFAPAILWNCSYSRYRKVRTPNLLSGLVRRLRSRDKSSWSTTWSRVHYG